LTSPGTSRRNGGWRSQPCCGRLRPVNKYLGRKSSYLRRTPEEGGYNANINFLNQHPNGFREIINGFLNSRECQLRFGRISGKTISSKFKVQS